MAISVETAQIPTEGLSVPVTEYRSYMTTSKEGVIETFAAPLKDLEEQAHTTSKSDLDEIVRKGLDVYCNEIFSYNDRVACIKRLNPPRLHIVASKAGEIIQKGKERIKEEEANPNGKPHYCY